MKIREEIISNYIEGYNSFDVPKMIANFSDEIIFKNIENGETTLTLTGIDEFKSQAQAMKNYFSERQQKINSFRHDEESSEIDIAYVGVLAMDFPNGMKKGQKLFLNGRSIFVFKDEKIIALTDIS